MSKICKLKSVSNDRTIKGEPFPTYLTLQYKDCYFKTLLLLSIFSNFIIVLSNFQLGFLYFWHERGKFELTQNILNQWVSTHQISLSNTVDKEICSIHLMRPGFVPLMIGPAYCFTSSHGRSLAVATKEPRVINLVGWVKSKVPLIGGH